jgi:nucleotide-binding universal stress UspA family protein
MTIRRVLVGLDGSDDAQRAATFAATLCAQLDAEAIGIHAMGLLEAFGGDSAGGKHLAGARQHAHAELEGPWRRPFQAAGVRHRVELRDGNPVHVLLGAFHRFHRGLRRVTGRCPPMS